MDERGEPIDAAEQAERSFAQTVLDLVSVIIIAVDPSKRVVLINKMGCRLLELEEEEEILEQSWYQEGS